MHEGQLVVPTATVRRLVADQFPGYGDLPVTAIHPGGTVYAVFRLGENLSARFPLQPADPRQTGELLREEAERARLLHGRTRFLTPRCVAIGRPGHGYPLPWAIHTWVPGRVATATDPGAGDALARDLAEFIAVTRAIDTHGAVHDGRGRGGPDLRVNDAWMAECLDRSADLLDVPVLREIWSHLRTLPRGETPDVMSHGDLMPGNVLVADGRLTGVLDVGGLAPADPALDLVAGWNLLDDGPRETLRETLGCDDLTWDRGRAWAFVQSMGLVWYYATSNPPMSHTGRSVLARIVGSWASAASA